MTQISKSVRSFIWRSNNSSVTASEILNTIVLPSSRLKVLIVETRQNQNNQIDYNELARRLRSLEILGLNDENATDLSSLISANQSTLREISFHRMYRLVNFERALIGCQKLEKLDLNQCYQMNDLCRILEHLNLTTLYLANTQPNQTTLGSILTLTNLQKLDVSCNYRVNNAFVRMLSNCLKKLKWLSLAQCHIDDEAIVSLTRLDQLRELNLGHTLITKNGVKLLHSSKLTLLNLSNCTKIEQAVNTVNRLLTFTPTIKSIGLSGFEQLVVDAALSYHVHVF